MERRHQCTLPFLRSLSAYSHLVQDPTLRKQFKQFANTDETVQTVETITERGQSRPADWGQPYPGVKLEPGQIDCRPEEWEWRTMLSYDSLMPNDHSPTCVFLDYVRNRRALSRRTGALLSSTAIRNWPSSTYLLEASSQRSSNVLIGARSSLVCCYVAS